jgi:polyhydroxybutyrate depolymerase
MTGTSAFQSFFLGHSASAGPALVPEPAVLERPEGPRRYLIAKGEGARPGQRPLVLVLHGGGASAAQVMGLAFPPSPLSVFLEIAARDDLVVIAPDAGKGPWSDCFASAKQLARKDDVGFIGALIDHAVAVHDADPARVYLIGVSRGGWMAYRVAAELPHKLAAFSAVLAAMPPPGHLVTPSVPLPALIFGGTADPLIRYQGGRHWYAPPALPPARGIEATAHFWRELAGLPDTPQMTTIPRSDPRDRTRVTRFLWGGRADGMQVGLYRIDGAGHAEPSRLKRYPGFLDYLPGRQNGDLEVAEAAWEFFREKRLG